MHVRYQLKNLCEYDRKEQIKQNKYASMVGISKVLAYANVSLIHDPKPTKKFVIHILSCC
jgi:hypothetical protein